MSIYLLFLFLSFMPFSWLRWFQSFFYFRWPSFSSFFFMSFSWSWAVFFFFFPFFWGPCVDSCLLFLSFFSGGLVSTVVFLFFFLFSGGLVSTVFFLLFLFFFFLLGASHFFFLFLELSFSSFSFLFSGGPCVFSRHRLNKPFETDPYVSRLDIGNPKTRKTLRLLSSRLFDIRRERHNFSMLIAFTSSALNPTNARRP